MSIKSFPIQTFFKNWIFFSELEVCLSISKNKSNFFIMRRRLCVVINKCNVYLPNLAISWVYQIQRKTMLPWSSKQTTELKTNEINYLGKLVPFPWINSLAPGPLLHAEKINTDNKLHTQYNTPCPKKSRKIQVLWKTNPQTIDKCNKEHLCFIPFITFKFVYFFSVWILRE